MYYNTKTYPASTAEKWDPEEVLQLDNPTRGITCVGEAPSMRRRCRNRVAASRYGQQLLSTLAKKEPIEAAKSDMLEQAAEFMLCWRHGDQASTVAEEWRFMLKSHSATESCASSLASTLRPQAKANITKFSVTKTTTIKVEFEEEYLSTRSPKDNTRDRQEESAQAAAERARRQEEMRRQKQKEEEEKRKREQQQAFEMAYQEWKIEELKRAYQKLKQELREEQERREQEAREERIRERARVMRETREREAREKVRKEAAEWRESWDRYSQAWEDTTALKADSITWPVKSGLRADVSEANIRLFFDKAPPVSSGELYYKLINSENRRWHTDKLMQRLGEDVVNGAAKDVFALVSKVLVVLRQEAQRKRRE
ncbi:hypothetical protein MGN70_011562 [Eutypa lata]|nr:hypothetical protein MGN70_011562 [Eutypa lata]